MRPLVFHPEAIAELQEQAVYYDERSAGLGERFVSQVEIAAGLASSMPKIGIPYKHRTRRVFPKDFPFSIVYREIGETLVVVAIAAFHRRPGYWRHRK